MAELSKGEIEGRRSPTETLVYAMEEFGKSEPLDCLVAWLDDDGNLCWSQSTRSRTFLIGMVDVIRELAIHDMVNERKQE